MCESLSDALGDVGLLELLRSTEAAMSVLRTLGSGKTGAEN